MALVTLDVVPFTAPTGGGTQNIGSAKFDEAPVAAIVIGTRTTVDDTRVDHVGISYGITDGTVTRNHAIQEEDGTGTTNTHRDQDNSEIIKFLDPLDATTDGEANFSTFDFSGGEGRLNIVWGINPAAAYLCYAILIGGTSCEAVVRDLTEGNLTSGSTTDLADFGFTDNAPAELLVTVGTTGNEDSTPGSTNARLCMGYAAETGSGITQGMFAYVSIDNKNAQNTAIVLSNDRYFCNHGITGGTSCNILGMSEVTNMRKGGNGDIVEITRREQTANLSYGLLALTWDGNAQIDVGWDTTPTTASTKSHEGPGFEPKFVMGVATAIATIASEQCTDPGSGVPVSTCGLFAFVDDEEQAVVWNSDDNADTTNCFTKKDSLNMLITDDVDADVNIGTFLAFDSLGWNTSYATSGNDQFLSAAIGDAADTGGLAHVRGAKQNIRRGLTGATVAANALRQRRLEVWR